MDGYRAGEDERQVLAVLVREYARLGEGPIIVEMAVMDWFAVVAGVQLAMRHPGLSAHQTVALGRAAREMTEAVRQRSPELGDMLNLGFDWERMCERG